MGLGMGLGWVWDVFGMSLAFKEVFHTGIADEVCHFVSSDPSGLFDFFGVLWEWFGCREFGEIDEIVDTASESGETGREMREVFEGVSSFFQDLSTGCDEGGFFLFRMTFREGPDAGASGFHDEITGLGTILTP